MRVRKSPPLEEWGAIVSTLVILTMTGQHITQPIDYNYNIFGIVLQSGRRRGRRPGDDLGRIYW